MSVATRNTLHWCLRGVLILAFPLGIAPARGQRSDHELPVVISASVPSYPRVALLVHILGNVRIRVSTDGSKVVSFADEAGPPMLVQAAKDNILSWRFDKHKPTTFVVNFQYRIEDEFSCAFENSSVILHIPSEVQISTKGVHTCDPSVEIKH
jgi:hypothetical protein